MKCYSINLSGSAGNPFEAIAGALGPQQCELADNAYQALDKAMRRLSAKDLTRLESISCSLVGPVPQDRDG